LKYSFFLFLSILISFTAFAGSEVEIPEIIIQGQESQIKIEKGSTVPGVYLNKKALSGEIENGFYCFSFTVEEKASLELVIDTERTVYELDPIPLWYSIIPPLIAILLALLFKEVISSLLLGLLSGCIIIYSHSVSGFEGILLAFLRLTDHYLINALNNSGHLSIIVFSMVIGGMVAIISKNGGMQGVVDHLTKYAKSAKSGQLATWFLGIAIFFDDYANTLIVGNTMRPVMDRYRVSRQKLAYLVDSTAAPIASIAFITTWIGAELGYIESGIGEISNLDEGVYAVFINSLAYSFYPILALAFMLMLILKQRDFGPMYRAEINARKGRSNLGNKEDTDDEFSPKADLKPKARNAIIPVFVVITGTFAGLFYTGWDEAVWNSSTSFISKLSTIIGQADSYKALLWSSLASLIVAILMSVSQRIMKLGEGVDTAIHGFKTMLPAIIILILAWSLAEVIDDLHTADFLTSIMSEQVAAVFVPAITFILAALVAFSTGSSWGTMAILYPLMLPTAWEISQQTGLDYDQSLAIFHNVVSCVLAGAVLGDHCSPISDTTILSSLASGCNHIEHVKTQMPYALSVGLVALGVGTIPSAFGVPSWLCFSIALACLFGIVHFFGKKVPNHA
jgi:Na+/H+ antiporter NhaC